MKVLKIKPWNQWFLLLSLGFNEWLCEQIIGMPGEIALPGSVLAPGASSSTSRPTAVVQGLPGDANCWEAAQGLSAVILIAGTAIWCRNREENPNIRQEEEKAASDLLEKQARSTWCSSHCAFWVVLLLVWLPALPQLFSYKDCSSSSSFRFG